MVSGGGACDAGHGPIGDNGVPAGYEPYGKDGRMLRDTISGHLYLTPSYQAQVDAIHIDWGGVAVDLGSIAAQSVGGAAIGLYDAGLIVVQAGINLLHDVHQNLHQNNGS